MEAPKCKICGSRHYGMCEVDKASLDAAVTGQGFMQAGKRVAPESVHIVEGKSVSVTHRLPTDLLDQVDAMAKGWGDSRSRALRRLIHVGLEHSFGC